MTKARNGALLAWLLERTDFASDDCLIFPYPRSSSGYGMVRMNGKRVGAHVAMCISVYGPAPTPKHEVAHSCGKGHEGCVNPTHLRWATRKENFGDRIEHGTSNRGDTNGGSKLRLEQVLKILELHKSGVPRWKIAQQFSVSSSNVSRIISGNTWGWVNAK